jgi:CBS domain containing-hemolysin-like protein
MPVGLVRRMLVLEGHRTLQQVLLAMRRARIHAGLVVDASGRTTGLVTLEDVLGALVGDIGLEEGSGSAS